VRDELPHAQAGRDPLLHDDRVPAGADRAALDGPAGPDGVGALDGGRTRLTAFVHGRVQGVGLRWWCRSRALELGVAGSATNTADGRVVVVAEGARGACLAMLQLLAEQPTTSGRPGVVDGVVDQWAAPRGTAHGFVER
jgi:acylphosphatase